MSVHLTFDIDWAPDWSIEEVLVTLEKYDVKGTFFCTHQTDLNNEILSKGHNLGIHPNFLPGTTQGSDTESIIEYLINIAPHATSLRTHALVQSSPLMHEIFSKFPQLKYDLSLLTPSIPLSRFIDWKFDGVAFRRIHYQWEDDACFWDKSYDWGKIKVLSPFFVMDFHPIHISLNSCSLINYSKFKSSLGGVSMMNSSRANITNFINKDLGAKDALEYILDNHICISFEDLVCGLE